MSKNRQKKRRIQLNKLNTRSGRNTKKEELTIGKRLSNMSKRGLSIIDLQLEKSETRLQEQLHQPIDSNIYYRAAFFFLLFNSNNNTGISFEQRLEKKYDFELKKANDYWMSQGAPTYYRLPVFLQEIGNPLQPMFNNILRDNFIRIHPNHESIYSSIISYTCYGEELNISEEQLSLIVDTFNNFLVQHNYPIHCYGIQFKGVFLQFLLGEIGKFNSSLSTTDEINAKDDDFGDKTV